MKLLKNKRLIIVLLFLSGIFLFVLCIYRYDPALDQPLARQGYLDLSDWNFDKQGNIRLDGEWEFYWDTLMEPSDFMSYEQISVSKSDSFMKVPSSWNSAPKENQYQAMGVATYRLKVKLKPDQIMYGIKTMSIRMANRIYVNGKEIGKSGTPGTSAKDSYVMANVPYVSYFYAENNELEIIIQVADFDYKAGGIVQSIYLGRKEDISNLADRSLLQNGFVSASLFVTGVYYLFVYLGKQSDKSVLYYGLSTIMFSLTLIAYGEKPIMRILPDIPSMLLLKAQSVFMYATTILTCLFANKVTEPLMPKWFAPTVVTVLGGYMMIFPFLPLNVSTTLENFFLFFGMAAYILITLYIVMALLRKKYGLLRKNEFLQLLSAFICILIFFGDGMAYNNNMKHDNILGYSVLLVFIGIVSLMLSQHYKNAYQTIQNMNNQLLELDKLKDEFLANTSHELRTPLNGIINLTQSVIEKTNGQLESLQMEDLKLVITSGRRLSRLVNDILDMSCLQRGEIKLTKKTLDVKAAASVVLHVLEHLKEDKKIELINSIPKDLPYVEADEERLLQILYNLIGNAIKYTKIGSVEVGGRQQGGTLKLWVKDSGCGIPYDRQEDVFKAFYQVETSDVKENRGTGLGLSISKQLVELHGGSIAVVSTPGEGSTFSFTLPMSKSTIPENESVTEKQELSRKEDVGSTRQEEKKRNNWKYSILVAEDDPTNLRALLTIMDSEDYYIKAVSDGQQALEEFNNKPNYDLLILDVMMPMLTGYQVLVEVRKRLSAIELPVILLTAKTRIQDIKVGFEAGANDYIAKPFEAEELKNRVSTLVRFKKTVNSLLSAELNFLQAQIKPHFLYNALSVITSLTIREPIRAKELLINLSDYLRGSFHFENHNGLVFLSDELQTVRAYLAIEAARFEERLRVEYDIEVDIAVSIPILCLQPLVENAVRHGIIQRIEGGTVRVTIKDDDEKVRITVEDDGIGMSEEKIAMLFSETESKGVGVRNIHKRMLALYGHGLQIESAPDCGTKVTIVIPIKPL